MDIVINGLLFGLLLCVLIGPVFFALIQNAIEKGFYSGFFMAIGIALSDAFYIVRETNIRMVQFAFLINQDRFCVRYCYRTSGVK